MPKALPEEDQVAEPDVVYVSPLQLKPGRVLLGLLAGVIIIAIGVVGARVFSNILDPGATPINPIEIKKSTSSAQKNEIADWKTFTGSTGIISGQPDETGVRFSVNYPPNLATKDRDHNYALVHSSPYRLAGPEQPGEISVLLGTYMESGKKTIAEGYNGKVTDTTLSGKKSTRHIHTSSNAGITHNIVNYVVMDVGKNNWGFEFRCFYFPKEGLDLEKTCDLMASTFKFLD